MSTLLVLVGLAVGLIALVGLVKGSVRWAGLADRPRSGLALGLALAALTLGAALAPPRNEATAGREAATRTSAPTATPVVERAAGRRRPRSPRWALPGMIPGPR